MQIGRVHIASSRFSFADKDSFMKKPKCYMLTIFLYSEKEAFSEEKLYERNEILRKQCASVFNRNCETRPCLLMHRESTNKAVS